MIKVTKPTNRQLFLENAEKMNAAQQKMKEHLNLLKSSHKKMKKNKKKNDNENKGDN